MQPAALLASVGEIQAAPWKVSRPRAVVAERGKRKAQRGGTMLTASLLSLQKNDSMDGGADCQGLSAELGRCGCEVDG